MAVRGRVALRRRLAGYWRMEAGNVLLVPAVPIVLAWRWNEPLGAASLVSLGAACLLLIVGACYWRARHLELLDGRATTPTVRWIARGRPWWIGATAAAVLAAVASWAGAAAGSLDRWVATVAAALAVAEYVNYFHVQLQHFDNIADLRRLLTGQGLRRAHLARDIAALGGRPTVK
jgi:hypothetical protein